MSESKYPLCEAAGLTDKGSRYLKNPDYFIAASDVEAWIAASPVVYGTFEKFEVGQFEMHMQKYDWATASARLINIQPIVRESEERQLLRELIRERKSPSMNATDIVDRILDRARALLEAK